MLTNEQMTSSIEQVNCLEGWRSSARSIYISGTELQVLREYCGYVSYSLSHMTYNDCLLDYM